MATTFCTQNPCWIQEGPTVNGQGKEEEKIGIRGFGQKMPKIAGNFCADGGMEITGTQIRYIAQNEEDREEVDTHDSTDTILSITSQAQNRSCIHEELTAKFCQEKEEIDLGGFEKKMMRIYEDFCADGGIQNSGTELLYITEDEENTKEADANDGTDDVHLNDIVIFVALMKDCIEQNDLHRGQQVHADLVKTRLLEKNIIVGNTLVNMYAKCGALQKSHEVFENLPAWSIVSWNILLAGYIQHGHNEIAMYYFERMQFEGFHPNEITFTCILKACSSVRDSDMGQVLHAHMVRDGLLEINVHVGTALLDMYAKCGLLEKAREIFDNLPFRNIVSWTALIIGYTQYEHGAEAFSCFEQMQVEGFVPDAFTFSCTLKACCSMGALDKGQQIHAWVIKGALLDENIVVASALVDMYAKCGALDRAHSVFDMLPVRDRIAWTALISGYALHGHGKEALICYNEMQLDGLFPNEVTFAGILKACCSIGATETGQRIHAEIIREGLFGKDIHLGTALVDMYAKCGLIAKAEDVFDNLQVRDVATWTALITAYVQNEQLEDVWFFFEQMQFEGIFPDAVTFSCILTACGSVTAVDKGQKVHIEIMKLGLVEADMVVGTALVDMYVNCGMIIEAQDVFDKLQVRDVVSWSAIMVGYAQLGKEESVFELLDKMMEEGVEPNLATFTIVLNTCSHRGLIDESQIYFEILSNACGISPNLEQHTCMVDLFGRVGNLDEAVAVIMEMYMVSNLTLWTTLLSACRRWGNVKLGRWAFEHAIQTDEKDGAAYICMNNIYAAVGRHEDAHKIEVMRIENQAWNLNEGGAFLIE